MHVNYFSTDFPDTTHSKFRKKEEHTLATSGTFWKITTGKALLFTMGIRHAQRNDASKNMLLKLFNVKIIPLRFDILKK